MALWPWPGPCWPSTRAAPPSTWAGAPSSSALLSAVIGAIIYYIVIQIVLRLGLDPNDLKLLTALVVAVFLSIPYWKGRYFTKAVRKGGNVHA